MGDDQLHPPFAFEPVGRDREPVCRVRRRPPPWRRQPPSPSRRTSLENLLEQADAKHSETPAPAAAFENLDDAVEMWKHEPKALRELREEIEGGP